MSNDPDPEAILTDALAHHEAGRIGLAEAGYRAVLQCNPDEPDALNLLGLILQERGELDESIALIARALEIDPDFPEALTNFARAQRVAGEPELAADAARSAGALDAELAEAHLQLGRALLDLNDSAGAAASLRTAATLAPKSVEAWLNLGIAQIQLGDHAAAADTLSRALALDPSRSDAMIDLGKTLRNLDRLDEAAEWHRQAADLVPENPDAHAALAFTLSHRMDFPGSIAACHRTLNLAPDRVEIWLLLGRNFASTGRFAGSEASCRKALALNPQSADALRDLAKIGRSADTTTDIAGMWAVLASPDAPQAERVSSGFALGTALDRIEDYDGAFAAFEGANQLILASQTEAGHRFDRAALRQFVDWTIANVRQDCFAATAEWGDPADLPVFIVGMPRSGTSLVEQIAASHGLVFGAGERKDIGAIVRSLNGNAAGRTPAAWDREATHEAATAYTARLQALDGEARRVIDKMPDNCMLLGQIAVLFPNARVIICRRDLRDVCLSCYFQQFADNMTWTSDQSDLAVRATEIDRLLAHWRQVLPIRVTEIDYETLVADLEGESRRLIAFLGLDWDPNCLAFDTTERPVTTASYWQVRQPLYASSVGRWHRYRLHLQPLLDGLRDVIRDAAK